MGFCMNMRKKLFIVSLCLFSEVSFASGSDGGGGKKTHRRSQSAASFFLGLVRSDGRVWLPVALRDAREGLNALDEFREYRAGMQAAMDAMPDGAGSSAPLDSRFDSLGSGFNSPGAAQQRHPFSPLVSPAAAAAAGVATVQGADLELPTPATPPVAQGTPQAFTPFLQPQGPVSPLLLSPFVIAQGAVQNNENGFNTPPHNHQHAFLRSGSGQSSPNSSPRIAFHTPAGGGGAAASPLAAAQGAEPGVAQQDGFRTPPHNHQHAFLRLIHSLSSHSSPNSSPRIAFHTPAGAAADAADAGENDETSALMGRGFYGGHRGLLDASWRAAAASAMNLLPANQEPWSGVVEQSPLTAAAAALQNQQGGGAAAQGGGGAAAAASATGSTTQQRKAGAKSKASDGESKEDDADKKRDKK